MRYGVGPILPVYIFRYRAVSAYSASRSSPQQAVLLQLPVQIALADAQNAGGVPTVAVARLQGAADVSQFQFVQRGQSRVFRNRRTCRRCQHGPTDRRRQMLGENLRVL